MALTPVTAVPVGDTARQTEDGYEKMKAETRARLLRASKSKRTHETVFPEALQKGPTLPTA